MSWSSSPTRTGRAGTPARSTRGSGCWPAHEAQRRPGPYQLQAAIAAGHAQGSDPATIVAAYDALLRLDPSPVARLNHAVAVALAGDLERGLTLIDGLAGLDGYRHFHAARADLLRRSGRFPEAHEAYLRAIALTEDGPERAFLVRRSSETASEPQE